MKQPGFFDLQQRYAGLDEADPLVQLAQGIPWEEFRGPVEQIHTQQRKSAAGRRPWDAVLMMKALVLGSLYNLSDEQLEYQIRDRLSFMRFLGLQLEDGVPDARTLWRYREELTKRGLMQELFQRFEGYLQRQGYQARKGQIVDASIVPVPKQRNTREENRRIKAGEVPEGWSEQKRRHKDVDARWTLKEKQYHYGYKNHLSVDVQYKLVRRYAVSSANVNESRYCTQLLDEGQRGAPVYADGAYRSVEQVRELRAQGYIERLHYKGHKHRPLKDWQKQRNHHRARIRVRVEHVFGFQHNSMGGKFLRCIGLARATLRIGMMNLVYNFMRLLQLQRLQAHSP